MAIGMCLCSQLAGLIETTHIVLRLLDSITKEDGALRVSHQLPLIVPIFFKEWILLVLF